jgi:hypothetical protein
MTQIKTYLSTRLFMVHIRAVQPRSTRSLVVRFALSPFRPPLCVPKTSSNTLELAGPRWLTWRRLVCSSSPSATIPLRTALSRDFVARNRQELQHPETDLCTLERG